MRANVQDQGTDYPIQSETVASTAAVTSAWHPCSGVTEFYFWYKAASATGTADIKVEIEQCPIENPYASGDPTITTSIDATTTPTETLLTATNSTVNAIVSSQYRIIVTGVASNPADTIADVWVSKR